MNEVIRCNACGSRLADTFVAMCPACRADLEKAGHYRERVDSVLRRAVLALVGVSPFSAGTAASTQVPSTPDDPSGWGGAGFEQEAAMTAGWSQAAARGVGIVGPLRQSTSSAGGFYEFYPRGHGGQPTGEYTSSAGTRRPPVMQEGAPCGR
jgi:hypothetical protein